MKNIKFVIPVLIIHVILLSGCNNRHTVKDDSLENLIRDHKIDTIQEAAAEGDLKTLDRLLEQGADINGRTSYEWDSHQRSALDQAILAKNGKIVKRLIEKGAKLSIYNAIELDDISTVKRLIDEGVNLNAIDPSYGSSYPMDSAIFYNRIDMVRLLVSKGCNIRMKKSGGDTYLHGAAAFGRLGIVKMLIAAGAEVDVADKEKETPVYSAAERLWDSPRNQLVIKLLVSEGADPNKRSKAYGYNALYQIVRNGYPDLAKDILSKNGTWDVFIASGIGDEKHLIECLRNTKNVNIKDGLGYTPLHWAAEGGNLAAVKLLVNAGANINASNKYGNTPLIMALDGYDRYRFSQLFGVVWPKASQDANKEVARFLINNGANVVFTDQYGRSPIDYAEHQGWSDIANSMRQKAK